MILSKFTTAIIAGAIAITTFTTAPVAAASDSDRLAQILLGAAAIGVIVHTAKKRKRARQEVTHYDNYQHRQPRVVHNRHRPKTCLRKKYTHDGWKTFYSRKCLERHRSQSHNHNTHKHNGHQNSRHYKKHHKNTHRNQATYNNSYKWRESEK
jgi:hypothetical protein